MCAHTAKNQFVGDGVLDVPPVCLRNAIILICPAGQAFIFLLVQENEAKEHTKGGIVSPLWNPPVWRKPGHRRCQQAFLLPAAVLNSH